jgi:hypothetical protein
MDPKIDLDKLLLREDFTKRGNLERRMHIFFFFSAVAFDKFVPVNLRDYKEYVEASCGRKTVNEYNVFVATNNVWYFYNGWNRKQIDIYVKKLKALYPKISFTYVVLPVDIKWMSLPWIECVHGKVPDGEGERGEDKKNAKLDAERGEDAAFRRERTIIHLYQDTFFVTVPTPSLVNKIKSILKETASLQLYCTMRNMILIIIPLCILAFFRKSRRESPCPHLVSGSSLQIANLTLVLIAIKPI